jgi:Sulfotransferase domain
MPNEEHYDASGGIDHAEWRRWAGRRVSSWAEPGRQAISPADARVLVWLASYPRSGNTFFRVILKSLYGIGSSSVYPKEAAGRVSAWLAEPRPQREQDPAFTKTHELTAAADPNPAIYLVRDGRDAYVSYAHFAMTLDPNGYPEMSYADVLRMLIESRDHFGGWSAHVAAWTRRPVPTAVLRYEQLVADPAGAAARGCAELGLELPRPSGSLPEEEVVRSWSTLTFRKGTVGSWKDEMPAELEQSFWNLHGDAMTRLGYRR